MRVFSLSLEQFRTYSIQQVLFGEEDIQLFIGENGVGKTNLLEALSVVSMTRSCRGRDEEDMVAWGQAYYRIRAEVVGDDGTAHRLEVVSECSPRKRKAFFINDVRTHLGGMVGFLPTVTFLPQDLQLFSGAPAERRRFLDQLLSQLSPDYLVTLSQYQKILQQRNALLKRIAQGTQDRRALDVWDLALAEKGSAVTLARLELIHTLNLSFVQELERLGELWPDARLLYERKTHAHDRETLQQELQDTLLLSREKDILLHSTTAGPHREDWQVLRDGRELPTFASRGQERVAVLALLLLEVSYLELRRGEKPVILLDDAFSELDDRHQTALVDGFCGHQVLMTATRIPPHAEHARIFSVMPGQVNAYQEARA